jgi:gamma-glutamylcyclotransferase (GGCT)/AIG2-like uncharacterized protein YtfP
MKYYFAYGSNMDLDQMKERCGNEFKFVAVVYLEGFKFVYDGYSEKRKGSVANIVECSGEKVWGVLYEITENAEKKLDENEGYPFTYQKRYVTVKDKEGKEYKAFVYLRKPQEIGKPSKDYMNQIIKAAYAHKLPSSYIEKYLRVSDVS